MQNQVEKRRKIIRLLIALLVIISISVGLFFIFRAAGITDIEKMQEWISATGAWSIVVFLLVQIAFTTLLSFVPVASMSFILLGVALFGPNWKTFLICFSGVIISSVLMDLIGRFGGSKLIKLLVGEEDYNNATALVHERGPVYVPVMYLLPMFPDDAICMVVGATKINFWIHLAEIVLCRGIGCATIVFGISVLPKELMDNLKAFNWDYIGNHLFNYIEVLTVLVFWVIVMLWLARKIDKWLMKKLAKKHEQEESVKENNEESLK